MKIKSISIVLLIISMFSMDLKACDGMSASVLSNVYMGNNQYQVTIQYCESVSNGAGAAVTGIILQSTGSGTITGTTTPSFTSNSTGVTINYNQINSNTVQWGEWDDNPNVPTFLNNGNPTQCFTMVINTNGPITQVAISGSSANSNLGAGFVSWFGRYCCKMTLNVPPVTCNSSWTAPQICPGSGPIDLDNYTSLIGVFSGPGVNSATGVFDPSAVTLPVNVTFTVGDAGLSCSTVHAITSPYTMTPINDQTICTGQSATLTASASASLPCTYTLNLQDSYGDGWQGGANVNLYINGVLYGNYTLATGSASNINFPVSSGDVITMTYTAGSTFNSENRVRIANSSGTYVYTSNWGPPSGSMGSGITANCGTNTSFNYSWSPSTGLSTTTGATTVASPSSTTTYTVTATNTVTGCVMTEAVTVNVSNGTVPTFTPINYLCQNDVAPTLPSVSNNGISGTWSPAVSTSTPGPATYTFTANPGQCASNTTMTITTLGAQRIAPLGAQCSPGILNFEALPNPGPSGITYSWQVNPPPGLTVSATAGSGQTFSTTATNTTNAPITFTAPNSITVTMTVGGVTCIKTFGPTINPTPLIANEATTICSGQSFTVSPSLASPNIIPSGTTYTWVVSDNPSVAGESSVSAGQPNISQTLTNTGSTPQTVAYTVTPLSGAAGACVGPPFTATITVEPTPNIQIPDQAVCAGGTVSLTASGANTYSWSPSTYLSSGTGSNVTFSAGNTTSYVVTGTTSAGCIGSDAFVVTVNANASIGAGLDVAICAGQSTTLTASGGVNYNWTGLGSNAVQTVTPSATTTYTVSGTDANGCSGTDQVTVTVNPNPVPVISGPSTYCVGNFPTLSTTQPFDSYTWSTGANTPTTIVSEADNPITVTVAYASGCQNTSAPFYVNENSVITYDETKIICQGESILIHGNIESVAGLYSQTFALPFGCDSVANITLVVNPLPVVNAGTDQIVCFGTNVTLTATGASTYQWTGAITNGTPFSPIAGTITYTVTGTDINGCIDNDQVDVTMNPLPNINAGADQSVCEGTQVTLTASGAVNYTWTAGVANGTAFTPAIGTSTYSVTGTDGNGCTNTDQVIVTVNALPNVFAGNDVSICDGETVTLTGSGASSYSWNNSVNNGVAFVPEVGALTYTVTGTTLAGCIGSDQVVVTVNPNPEVSFAPGITLGCAPLQTTLTNTTPDVSNCVWTISNGMVVTGCGTIPVEFTQAGCYDVTLTTTSSNGCSSSMTANDLICVEEPPIAAFAPSANQVSTLDTEVHFENETIGATQYLWTFGVDDDVSTEESPNYTFPSDEEGQYTVTLIATSPLGCVDTAISVITVYEELIFYVPNTFTPDQDEYNPTFKPVFTSGYDPQDYVLYIYDRWGELIFESRNAEVGWDGSYGTWDQSSNQIELCQDGTYTWKIEFKVTRWDERRVAIGHVNLIR
jgi:gliding motility-associated-like protein